MVHNLFAYIPLSCINMSDFATLFWLMLGMMALITACLLLIAYEMAKRDRGRTREPARAVKECAYFFGFLSKYALDKPIPNECFGCVLALSCTKAVEPVKDEPEEERIEVAKPQH